MFRSVLTIQSKDYETLCHRTRSARSGHNESRSIQGCCHNLQQCFGQCLRKFPFQKIKIDRSFIQGLGEEHDAQASIGAVAGLGASLDKRVVAEGIETEEQMRQVKAHGCHEGQGHFFGEPMPAEIIRARLAESTSVAQLVA